VGRRFHFELPLAGATVAVTEPGAIIIIVVDDDDVSVRRGLGAPTARGG